MERLVAGIVEYGDYYRVQFVARHEEKFIKNDSLYVNVSNVAFKHIQEALSENKIVLLPKNMVGSDEISFADLLYEDMGELLKRQNSAIIKERRLFDNELSLLSVLSVATWSMVNNEFCDKGIFITDENRDEVYLDIVSSGDEVMIDKLSRYLECMDDIKKVDFCRRRFEHFEKEVMNKKSIEELDSFLESFYSIEK